MPPALSLERLLNLVSQGDQRATFCSEHKLPEMINVSSRRCEAEGCLRHPNFGFQGDRRATFCWCAFRMVFSVSVSLFSFLVATSLCFVLEHSLSYTGSIQGQPFFHKFGLAGIRRLETHKLWHCEVLLYDAYSEALIALSRHKKQTLADLEGFEAVPLTQIT